MSGMLSSCGHSMDDVMDEVTCCRYTGSYRVEYRPSLKGEISRITDNEARVFHLIEDIDYSGRCGLVNPTEYHKVETFIARNNDRTIAEFGYHISRGYNEALRTLPIIYNLAVERFGQLCKVRRIRPPPRHSRHFGEQGV